MNRVIESTNPDCGCVVAGLEKKRYEPGERGEILARFTMGDRRGQREKSIRVSTDGLARCGIGLCLGVGFLG